VDGRENLSLTPWPSGHEQGLRRYVLDPGSTTDVTLRYT
jgi:hypothetical protein